MKTYISTVGFDASQFLSLIVKYGIEKNDRIVLLRPNTESDKRAEGTIEAIKKLSEQIDGTIIVDVFRVDHRDFEAMLLSIINLIQSINGAIIANISGGPREIFLAFTVACITQSRKIHRITNYGDIDRNLTEIQFPHIAHTIDEKTTKILSDVIEHEPTTISEIANRLNISESTVSRHISKSHKWKSIDIVQDGKIKLISATLTGKILIQTQNY